MTLTNILKNIKNSAKKTLNRRDHCQRVLMAISTLMILSGALIAGSASAFAQTKALAQAVAQAKNQSEVDSTVATPAIWKMTDEDSEIWILGTYHILPPTIDWRSAPVKRAIAAAELVYLEADVTSPSAQGDMLRTLMFKGFNPRGTTLTSMLTGDQTTKLKEIVESLNLSFKAIDAMRPWNAFITLSAQFIVAQGYDPSSGVDNALSLEIKASGRELRYFETASEQISFFADLPTEIELALLTSTLDNWDEASLEFDTLFNAWRDGDVPAMDTLINDSLRVESPEVYEVLLVKRNENWTQELTTLMEGSGTYLIAVGAGHLVGDQSVIAMMRGRGFTINRITE